jgi:hypothetical protein
VKMQKVFAATEEQKAVFSSLADIQDVIEQAVTAKRNATGMTYPDALYAVALENPSLFLTKARLELDRYLFQGKSIYFDYVDGELVNPATLENGVLTPIDDSPLSDTKPISPNLSPSQEIAVRVAGKMQKLAAAAKLAASEEPEGGSSRLVASNARIRPKSPKLREPGGPLRYSEAMRLIAAENPNLTDRSLRESRERTRFRR